MTQESTEETSTKTNAKDLVTIEMKSSFYKDSYIRIIFVLLLSITLNFGLASSILYIVTNPPQPKYFATSIKGRLTPLSPLDMPNQSDSAILQWANQAD